MDHTQQNRHDEGLLAAIAGVADAAAADVSADDLLHRLVEATVAHLDVDGAGVVAGVAGDLRLVHVSDDGTGAAETLQERLAEGPCHDAALFDVEVVVDDLHDPVQTAWPSYVDAALAAGWASVVAVPLQCAGRSWGVLDVYRRATGTWQQHELHWLRVLGHLAASYLALAADRDDARRARQALQHASTHDALTGLPNRVLIFDRLEHALSQARRRGRCVTVLFVDLDRFKAVNDTFGHAAGDRVLATVAAQLGAQLREGDTLGRLSGDEFVVVCDDLPADARERQRDVDALLARLRDALGRPVRLDDVDVVVSASTGVAHSSADSTAEDLLAAADAAMYRAKHPQRNQPTPGASLRDLERHLARALPEHRLRLHHQPITDATGAVRAVEALLRWEHPTRGLLPAGEFIDLAEHSGMVVAFGRWVAHEACAQLARWRARCGAGAPDTVYVNVSARELADPDLGRSLEAAAHRHGLTPADLGVEVLEESFTDPMVLPGLHDLQRRGHPLSIDDFGTGYSSLARLVDLPVRTVKVDKAIVRGITAAPGGDSRSRALLDAVLTVAAGLDVEVVAEGVESAAQAEVLLTAGCHHLQGFHCGRPVPADELEHRLGVAVTAGRTGAHPVRPG
ncbi:putative bifunctional diguanylate cyclase/phosphodiesterase [Kineococcus sp. TBRC 1896]|uniref:Bifunctional diguanylate cyclase/phosphodiesterase n=1 Tax=Kineococcus mangrovi TaxID=1660183 RepID=A0ABV4HXJ5_9ACTN